MPNFYSICDNSFQTRGFPWAQSIARGVDTIKICYACAREGRRIWRANGTVELVLDRRKGNRWPDVLGCGSEPLFIVSNRVLDDWQKSGIEHVSAFPIRISDPFPKKLEGSIPPSYFWLAGERMVGAKLDFERSGFVGVSFCAECGTRMDDVRATHRRRHEGAWPMAFVEGSWNGADIFTTDLSSAYYFCTEKVLACAKRNRHTNFRFVPAEIAASPATGIKYL